MSGQDRMVWCDVLSVLPLDTVKHAQASSVRHGEHKVTGSNREEQVTEQQELTWWAEWESAATCEVL